MVRLLTAAALAAAALATPAAAGPSACTPSTAPFHVGACVDVVCLKLCVTQIEVDPQCSMDRPVPLTVERTCSRIDGQYIVIGGG